MKTKDRLGTILASHPHDQPQSHCLVLLFKYFTMLWAVCVCVCVCVRSLTGTDIIFL